MHALGEIQGLSTNTRSTQYTLLALPTKDNFIVIIILY